MKVIDRLLITVGTRKAQRLLGWATLAGLASTAWLGLYVVPADAEQGDVQRLMYVHVPAAWLAFLSFGVVFLASVAYLRTGRIRWDRVAVASAEIGVLFCVLTLALGSLWGRPVWGTWWTWDPRLTTTVVLLLIYVGYLSLRSVADSPSRRAHWSAVVGVVGFVDVPIVHMSVVWWRSLHQEATVIRPGAPTMDPSMLAALLVGTVAFSVAYGYLMAVRLRIGRLEDHAAATVMSQPSPRAKAPRLVPASVRTVVPTQAGGKRRA
jgi:heme exporter protein C